MDKRGISALLATVLLILVSLAAVGIVYSVAIPMIRDSATKASLCSGTLNMMNYGSVCYDDSNKQVRLTVSGSENNIPLKNLYVNLISDTSTESYAVSPDNSVVAYYNFNEGSGNKAIDSSGKNNDGLITGAVYTGGKIGKALQFDGNDYVTIGNLGNIKTIEYWINPNSDWEDVLNIGIFNITGNGFIPLTMQDYSIYIDGNPDAALGDEKFQNPGMEEEYVYQGTNTSCYPVNYNTTGYLAQLWTCEAYFNGIGYSKTTTAHSGNQAQQMNAVNVIAMQQALSEISGNYYMFSSWVRTDTAGKKVRLRAYYGATSNQAEFTIPQANTWYKIQYLYRAPFTGSYLHFLIVYDLGHTIIFDDASFKEVKKIPAGKWSHVVITINNGSIAANSLTLGKIGNYYFKGLIDDVKIYNQTLSSEEISQEYNEGMSGRQKVYANLPEIGQIISYFLTGNNINQLILISSFEANGKEILCPGQQVMVSKC